MPLLFFYGVDKLVSEQQKYFEYLEDFSKEVERMIKLIVKQREKAQKEADSI